jgi:hypothetical protein
MLNGVAAPILIRWNCIDKWIVGAPGASRNAIKDQAQKLVAGGHLKRHGAGAAPGIRWRDLGPG